MKNGGKAVIRGAIYIPDSTADKLLHFITESYIGEASTVTISGEVYSSRNLTASESASLKVLEAKLSRAIEAAPLASVLDFFTSGK